MRLDAILARNDGFATREQLRQAGYSSHGIRLELAKGTLVAFTRDVVGRPTASPMLARAVRMSARVACVTAARRMGLWVLDSGFHVVPRARGRRFRPDGLAPPATLHWSAEPVVADRHRLAVSSGRNALAHIARCQPLDAAIATFDSAVHHGMISLAELRELASVHRGPFAKAVTLTTGLADSGLETITRVRLLWAGIGCREQVIVDGHPVDLLVGDRLIIQLDGRQHLQDPVQLARDRSQDRRLRRMGYTVLRFGYAEVVFGWEAVLEEIVAHLAQHAHTGR